MSAHTLPQRASAFATAAVLVLAACGPDTAATDAPASTSGDRQTAVGDISVPANGIMVDVSALDNSFRAERIEITPGTTVRWENDGRNDHNILPVDKPATWGVEIDRFAPGDAYTHVFSTPGEYAYYCSLHGTPDAGMAGSVVVTG